ncbi:MAG: tRNA lysidine(34) synthetase TilS [Pseudomonadota bacterium]
MPRPITPSLLTHPLEELTGAPIWLVAYSGGVDSTVLLHLLWSWCQHRSSPPLAAIHINHGLHSDAGRWAGHCQRQCAELGVDLFNASVDVAAFGSGEVAARNARYQVFEEHLTGGGVLFLGHHLDDQVETFFLRLMRGAGIDGLRAMRSRRTLGNGELVRPMLSCTRAEIAAYAAEASLDFIDDPSNTDQAMDRNYLRRSILPALGDRWPAYRRTVSRAVEQLAAGSELLHDSLGVPTTRYSVMEDPGIALDELGDVRSERGQRIRGWLRSRGLQTPPAAALEEFLGQLDFAVPDANPALRWGSYALQRYGDGVYLLPPDAVLPDRVVLDRDGGCDVAGIGYLQMRPTDTLGLLLSDSDSVTIRWRRGGERCTVRGRSERRALKKLLQEWRVPPWWRERIPLLYVNDELVAIADLAICDSPRWTDDPGGVQPRWEFCWLRARSQLTV